MTEEKAPSLRPYGRHILVCTGPRCAPQVSEEVYQHLKEKIREKGHHEGPDRINRSQCHCFGICQGGPLAVVYPEKVWYHHVTKEKADRILEEHLIGGRPVAEYSFPARENS